jgi:hypothetical protein
VKISNHDLSPTEGLGNFQAQMDHVNRRIDELREHLMSSEQNAGRKSSRSGGSA